MSSSYDDIAKVRKEMEREPHPLARELPPPSPKKIASMRRKWQQFFQARGWKDTP